MTGILSHIIRRQFSNQFENVATEALAYLLSESEEVSLTMGSIVRDVVNDLPPLRFRTQQNAGGMRPDLWGLAGATPRMLVENKFWAGLTDNQPVEYLGLLAEVTEPSALLFVVPGARQGVVWRELLRRLDDAEIRHDEVGTGPELEHACTTSLGPAMALTSWPKLLARLGPAVSDSAGLAADLEQLRSLCESADLDAFHPFKREDLTSHLIPSTIGQLTTVVRQAVDLGIGSGALSTKGTLPKANWDGAGQYASFPAPGVGLWLGVDYPAWKAHGFPVWLRFNATDWGRAHEVRPIAEPWAHARGLPIMKVDGVLYVAIDVPAGEDLDRTADRAHDPRFP